MVESSLVDSRFADGEKLLERLDQRGFPVTAAFWLRLSEEDDWRLILGSPLVDRLGPLKAYKRLQKVAGEISHRISLAEISLTSPKDRLVGVLKAAVKTRPAPAISGVRMQSNVINNVFIEDAYIYRLAN